MRGDHPVLFTVCPCQRCFLNTESEIPLHSGVNYPVSVNFSMQSTFEPYKIADTALLWISVKIAILCGSTQYIPPDYLFLFIYSSSLNNFLSLKSLIWIKLIPFYIFCDLCVCFSGRPQGFDPQQLRFCLVSSSPNQLQILPQLLSFLDSEPRFLITISTVYI